MSTAVNSLSREMVGLVRRWQAEGLPAAVRDKARLHVADAIAIGTAAAARSVLGRSALQALGASAGAPASYPPCLAFGMSACIHVLDYDDIHDFARVHPTVVTLPAVIAGAFSNPGSQVDPIEVVAHTNEIMCRLGVVCEPDGSNPASNYFLSQLFGYFGAALAASLAMNFDDEALVSALGLASMQAAGAKQAAFGVGSNARAIYPAFAAMGGVQAALLTRAGFAGPEGAFDGAAGLFPVSLGAALTAAQRASLLDTPQWVWMQTHVKPWPSCRLSHPFVHAALIAHRQFRAADIQRVRVQVDASVAKLCRPLEIRRRPITLQDAKYSIPFMIAFTLVHGAPTLLNLDDRVLGDAEVLAMAQRIEVDECLPDLTGLPAGTMSLESGSDRLELCEPLALQTDEPTVREKFGLCFNYAGRAAEAPEHWESIAQAGAGSAQALWRAFEGG